MRCQPRPPAFVFRPAGGRLPAGLLQAFIVLALAGCGPRSAPAGDNAGGEVPDAATANVATPARSAAELEARATAALRAALAQAPTRLLNVREGFNGAICGQVEMPPAGSAAGGTKLFLVTGRGEAFVSRAPTIELQDPTDPFPDLYMEWCASPEELRSLGDRLGRMRPEDVQLPLTPPANLSEPAPAPEAPPPAPPAPAPAPAPRPQRPPSNDETFFNAVVRPAPRD